MDNYINILKIQSVVCSHSIICSRDWSLVIGWSVPCNSRLILISGSLGTKVICVISWNSSTDTSITGCYYRNSLITAFLRVGTWRDDCRYWKIKGRCTIELITLTVCNNIHCKNKIKAWHRPPTCHIPKSRETSGNHVPYPTSLISLQSASAFLFQVLRFQVFLKHPAASGEQTHDRMIFESNNCKFSCPRFRSK